MDKMRLALQKELNAVGEGDPKESIKVQLLMCPVGRREDTLLGPSQILLAVSLHMIATKVLDLFHRVDLVVCLFVRSASNKTC